MGETSGRAQREAVNVIFRLLTALRNDEITLSRELLGRLRELDVAGIYSNLVVMATNVIESGANAQSLQMLRDEIRGTPFESIFSQGNEIE